MRDKSPDSPIAKSAKKMKHVAFKPDESLNARDNLPLSSFFKENDFSYEQGYKDYERTANEANRH